MTNYRLEMCEGDLLQWKYCPTCASKIILTNNGTYCCNNNAFHILISVTDDEDEDIKFN